MLFKNTMLLFLLTFSPAVATGFCAGQSADPESRVWIAVVPKEFCETIEPLRHRRETQGFETHIVRLDEVERIDGATGGAGLAIRNTIQEICASRPGFVLLVGNISPSDDGDPQHESASTVCGLPGTVGRMKGVVTDFAYGLIGDSALPTIAVGRFPARDVGELQVMIDKTIRFEQRAQQPLDSDWPTLAALVVGHPGGADAFEKQMAETFVIDSIRQQFESLNPLWKINAVVHAQSSPFYLPTSELKPAIVELLSKPPLLTVYLGHSGPEGFYSSPAYIFGRDDWQAVKTEKTSGIMFSCGCYGCIPACLEPGGDGYGIEGMRSGGGPVAVVGAIGESYAAGGKWAADGFFGELVSDTPSRTLGDYWLATLRGIHSAEMPTQVFQLLDQVDGSRGLSEIDEQRREHLQMWTLLGDPALQIPFVQNEIQSSISVNGDGVSNWIELSGELPSDFSGAKITVRVERPILSIPDNLFRFPKRGSDQEQSEIARKNFQLANDFSLAEFRAIAVGTKFKVRLDLPKKNHWDAAVFRITASSESRSLTGARTINNPNKPGKQPE